MRPIVRVPEMPGRDFPGKVTRIADALQPGTRTLLTEIDVPNPDRVLQPGVYCTDPNLLSPPIFQPMLTVVSNVSRTSPINAAHFAPSLR